jgi:uncharacterized membrane protein YdjX (TVP38/TMEM64 family)
MKHYRLSIKDKIYFWFHTDYESRSNYLEDKVARHEMKYFTSLRLRPPYDFKNYVISYTAHLIFEYENL